jgi:hypothetical protein
MTPLDLPVVAMNGKSGGRVPAAVRDQRVAEVVRMLLEGQRRSDVVALARDQRLPS